MTLADNATLVEEYGRGRAAHAELEAGLSGISSLDARIAAATSQYGLFGMDPKNPRRGRDSEQIRGRFSLAELEVARQQIAEVVLERNALTARVALLATIVRIAGVQDGIALCEDGPDDGEVLVYAPGKGTEAHWRRALVFQDDLSAAGWTVRLHYASPDGAGERKAHPGCFECPTRASGLELARQWVCKGASPERSAPVGCTS